MSDVVLQDFLTGNVREGAMAKLAAVGIAHHRFRVGAFGSDHASRPELPAIARTRAEAMLGHPVEGRDFIVIGDTPADMGCGRGIGAPAIGAATGRDSVGGPRAWQSAAAVSELSDTSAALA